MSIQTDQATSYDLIPYPSKPFPQTHPIRLATIATLFGLNPPPVDGCRVLELGCAAGGNLIPLADALPESTFLGIDGSARQVVDGRTGVTACGLTNVELRHMDIKDVDRSLGTFDYVICHGVFSWVPREVQEKILDICRDNLSADGVAYVSYNTYPGWHMRGMIRDMMLYHVATFREPAQQIQQARALLRFLSESARSEKDPYSILLKNELELLSKQPDGYLFHDHLEAVNEPVYFFQFVQRAAAHGLAYLGEVQVATMWSGNFEERVQEALKAIRSDAIKTEQYLDFIRNRMFRQTLLCHQGKPIDRRLNPARLSTLYVSSDLAPTASDATPGDTSSVTYRSTRGTVTASVPLLKAVLAVLHERWPGSVRVDELAEAATDRVVRESPGVEPRPALEALTGQVTRLYLKNLVEVQVRPFDLVTTVSDRPQTSRVVRWQAASSHTLTNRRHEPLRVDELSRRLLLNLDGLHDEDALRDTMLRAAADGQLQLHRSGGEAVSDVEEQRRLITEGVRKGLERLARAALLVA